ncbi:YggT family protein [Nocardioides sp. MH1]|uniref:YggT family protein n=1 Tax=Nocardioides sp. MH1 TaxID=3242490 RepID=UPI003521E452
MPIAGQIIEGVLWTFIGFLLIRLTFDYVQMFARAWQPRGVLLVLLEIVYTVTDPPLRALRRVIKPVRIGSFSLDLSFLLVLIAAIVLRAINIEIWRS